MTQKFYRQKVINGGAYIGAFDSGSAAKHPDVPAGSVSIQTADLPPHGKMHYAGDQWIDDRMPGEILAADLGASEGAGQVARKLEDILDHLVNGTPLPAITITWLNERQARRGA